MIDIVDDITSTCDNCIKYKKTRPWPAVGLPMASDFNEAVVMDLVNIGNWIWFMHLIDLFTQFLAALTITTKEKNVVTGVIFEICLSHFGQPRKFLADNGGELANEVYKELCDQFNIEFVTTAAESP